MSVQLESWNTIYNVGAPPESSYSSSCPQCGLRTIDGTREERYLYHTLLTCSMDFCVVSMNMKKP